MRRVDRRMCITNQMGIIDRQRETKGQRGTKMKGREKKRQWKEK